MIESECQVLYATFVPSSMADIFFDWNRRWNFLCSATYRASTFYYHNKLLAYS